MRFNLSGKGRPVLLTLIAVACLMIGMVLMGGVSLRLPFGHHGSALPDPVSPRPHPVLPTVQTAPLTLPAVAGATVVTLTFDDGFASNAEMAKILHDAGLNGTFFMNSGNIGKPGYLTLPQVDTMAQQGNEVAGHTVNHQDLDSLSLNEVTNEICQDRNTWLGWGFPVRNFAYPFALSSPEVEKIVAHCGYNSARDLGGLRTVHMPPNAKAGACAECAWAETTPPEDPYLTSAPAQVRSDWSVEDFQAQINAVTDSNGTQYSGVGGWVQITFHGMCPSDCTEIGVNKTVFEQFVHWLADQQKQGQFIVRTVGEVIGGQVKPAVPTSPPPTSLVNAGFENQNPGPGDGGVDPYCWTEGGFGDNKAEFFSAPGRSGMGEKVVVHDYHNGQRGLISTQDLGTCAVAAMPGQTPTLSAKYKSTVPTRFVVYYRTNRGNWFSSALGPIQPAVNGWTQTTWQAPPAPQGSTAISFGLVIMANGELDTDEYGLKP